MRACESRGGTPSLQGGGGGGHGFATGGGFAFGGGFGFSFRGSFREGSSSLDSLAVSPEGGATGQKVPGKAIGAAARACRKKCIPGAHTDGGQIYECYCHCTKTKFADLGLSWASKIECE